MKTKEAAVMLSLALFLGLGLGFLQPGITGFATHEQINTISDFMEFAQQNPGTFVLVVGDNEEYSDLSDQQTQEFLTVLGGKIAVKSIKRANEIFEKDKIVIGSVVSNSLVNEDGIIELRGSALYITGENIGTSLGLLRDYQFYPELRNKKVAITGEGIEVLLSSAQVVAQESEIAQEVEVAPQAEVVPDVEDVPEVLENDGVVEDVGVLLEESNEQSNYLFLLWLVPLLLVLTLVGMIIMHKHEGSDNASRHPELNDYVANARKAGYSDAQILDTLKKSGWPEKVVKEHM